MSGEWVRPARKVIRFWILQFIFWIAGIPLAIIIGISKIESLIFIGPIFFVVWIISIIFYAFKIANFFKGASLSSGGGALLASLKQWKWFLF